MQAVMNLKAERKARLAQHPFYDWVQRSDVPIEERLLFAPIMTNFVMNFRDMNLWFIRFAEAGDDFQRIINGNTLEDETHSRLFLEDWRKLGLDRKLGWSAGDTVWWLFLADDTEPFRRYAIDFARMTVVDEGDPLLRFAHSEAGEACGNCFFRVLSKVATALTRKTGIEYRYFGDHHLNREPGHVLESEGIFERMELDETRRRKALALANEMFDVFDGMHDCFLGYAARYVAHRSTPRRKKGPPLPISTVPPHTIPVAREPEPVAPEQTVLQRALDERRARTAQHPFYMWLQEDNGIAPIHKLQRFVPMWVMDIMGYRDLNRYALRFAQPRTDAERAFNRWTDALESHSALFLQDWDALDMDAVLSWSASDALEFFFLDPRTDVHRHNIATFIKLALAHTKPVLRFWLLEALEASGEAFFENTKQLARVVERYTGRRLDYLADRHDMAHPPGVDVVRRHPFKGVPLGAEDRDVVLGMIQTVFDAVDEQLSLSLEVAKANVFDVCNRFVVSAPRRASGA